MVVPRIREISSFYDSFIVSLDSGFVEEVVYPALHPIVFSVFPSDTCIRVLRPFWPGVVAILPKALAVVLSSLLFAMVHNIYGFTAAFFGGMLLGLIYMQSGIESAIAAHFCANFFILQRVLLVVKTR